MCSIIHRQQKGCCPSNNIFGQSKTHYEPPKQLLQLRSQVKPLIRTNRLSVSSDSSAENGTFSCPRPAFKNQKLHLTYIEKDDRKRQMIPQQTQYMAYDRPVQYQSRKMTPGGHSVRTPSSGFSSASSSENMFSGLSLQDSDPKLNELMDPAAEVDLDLFLLPDVRYKQPLQQPSASTSRINLSQISGPSQNSAYQRRVAPSQAKSAMPTPFSDYSYANIKRSSGYIDYMPPSCDLNPVTQQSLLTSPALLSSDAHIRCNYCWKTYVELCQRVAKLDPVIPCDGPWNWHSLYDHHGRVTCPRLWFAQLDRAGSEMLEQMGSKQNAPV